LLAFGALLVPALLGAAETPDTAPWRLSEAARLPDGLDLSGTQRTRYEALDPQFRVGPSGSDQMLALRTTLRVEAKFEAFSLVGELMDSRQELADARSPIDTTMVNAIELLQAYGAMRFDGYADSRNELRLGRQTLDIGSRRLVARNDFRNTTNFFNGLHWQSQFKSGAALRAFYLLPVTRRPSDAPALLENVVKFDRESFDTDFWGFHMQRPRLLFGATGEAYVFGLHEDDARDAPTRNRRLYTPGLRLHRRPTTGSWDLDVESAIQWGSARNSTAATDTRDLNHFAHFHHIEMGYTFGKSGAPRLALLYDYAGGDKSSSDGDSNRFDTLFGARRFDHGPTGIYGAFARSNIQSPGLRFSAKPESRLEIMTTYRAYWLASQTDAWTTSGLRDVEGKSGSFLGHQLEARLRWDIRPNNVRLEAGGAYLITGEFVHDAPNATSQGDTAYGYLSGEFAF
jgi:hypothetical protein